MRSVEVGDTARRWGSALSAVAGSGVFHPPGPRAIAGIVAGLARFGPTPATLVAVSAARYPERIALIDDRGAVTFQQLQQRSSAIAAALWAVCAGASPRSVGILCRNHRGFVEAMCAGAQLGCEVVFINTELPAAQLHALLRRHDPDILIYDDEFEPAVESSNFSGRRVRAWCDHPQTPTSTASIVATLDGLAAQRHPRPPRVHRPVRVTLLTSGTTGLAKGVPRSVTPRAIAQLAATAMATVRLRSGDTVATAAPFFHGFGLLGVLGALTLGATTVCHRRFDAGHLLADIAGRRVSVVLAVPVMLQRLLGLPPETLDAADTSSLRIAVTGASPISPATIGAFIERFGPILVNGYGSTEAGLISIATPADLAAAPRSVGRLALGVSLRILGDDRRPVPVGQTATIFVRSGLDYHGYTADPHNPVPGKEIVDGHVNTGDMGHLDEHGRLYIDGRADDMIVSGGENVFPGEVEDALTAHPAIGDAMAIGVDDPEFGQVLHAFAVLTAGAAQPSDDELQSHLRGRLERYKVPKRLVFIDEIPRNAAGKVLRTQLQT